MPLTNRVTPFGEIVAHPARGRLMGNRGILHDAERRFGTARWRHPHWVACRLAFKGRHRAVMTPGRYTELFFLDEAVALAAGHRPCAECRRDAFRAFQGAWRAAYGATPRAGEIDRVLHRDRVVPRTRLQRRCPGVLGGLPDGTLVALPDAPGTAWLVWRGRLWPYDPGGYGAAVTAAAGSAVEVLTPAATVDVLAAGYVPEVATG